MKTLLAILLLTAGCRSTTPEEPPATCVVTVRPHTGKAVAKGTGEGPSEEAAAAAAWDAVCAAMHEKDQPGCRDPARFTPSSVVVWKPAGTGKRWEVTLMLHPAAASTTAEVTGGDMTAACARAELEACKGAGAPENCVKSGQYDRVSNSVDQSLTVPQQIPRLP